MALLYVAIYQGGPDDIPHWSLYAQDDDGEGFIFEADGNMNTGLKFKYIEHVDILESQPPSEYPCIGRVEADVWPDVPAVLQRLPISKDPGWNCQSWVVEAVQELRKLGYLEMEDEKDLARIQLKYQKKWKDAQ